MLLSSSLLLLLLVLVVVVVVVVDYAIVASCFLHYLYNLSAFVCDCFFTVLLPPAETYSWSWRRRRKSTHIYSEIYIILRVVCAQLQLIDNKLSTQLCHQWYHDDTDLILFAHQSTSAPRKLLPRKFFSLQNIETNPPYNMIYF